MVQGELQSIGSRKPKIFFALHVFFVFYRVVWDVRDLGKLLQKLEKRISIEKNMRLLDYR